MMFESKCLKGLSLALASAACVAAAPVWAEDFSVTPQDIEQALEPSSKWVADFGDGYCALTRGFGSDDERVYLRIRRFTPNAALEFTVMGKGVRPRENDTLSFGFAATGPLRTHGGVLEVRGPDGRGILFKGHFKRRDTISDDRVLVTEVVEDEVASPLVPVGRRATEGDDNVASEADVFVLEGAVQDPVLLRTGPLDQAMQVMDTCMDDLLKDWGVDPAVIDEGGTSPRPKNIGRWARKIQFDYPSSALIRGLQGSVTATLIINAQGKAEKCITQLPYRDPVFQETACRGLLRYGEFEPARDGDGNAVTGLYQTTVVYRLS